MNHQKYKPYPRTPLPQRNWPNNNITEAPIWCAVDLRDGNQAIPSPMNIEQKLAYFQTLVAMGFKQIEISYPSASQTDFDFTRKLIDENIIPDDVFVQVLIPARESFIQKSIDALTGVRNAIVHLYNPTSKFQREIVFRKSKDEIIEMAVKSTALIHSLTKDFEGEILFEYTPESFSQTELDFACDICNAVIEQHMRFSPNKQMIINLANTTEMCFPHIFADRIEWMSRRLIERDSVILSVHAHNDMGGAVASSELALLAGAQRIEGTLFGNGERAGNTDLITMGFNLYANGIDPRIDVSHIDDVRQFVEDVTGIATHARHPFVGDLIYTAFSGGHQDAIKKGFDYHNKSDKCMWNVPYLPIDPADIGRNYSDMIRVNSQSGKGGMSFIIQHTLGITPTDEELALLSERVKRESEKKGKEVDKKEIIRIYQAIHTDSAIPSNAR